VVPMSSAPPLMDLDDGNEEAEGAAPAFDDAGPPELPEPAGVEEAELPPPPPDAAPADGALPLPLTDIPEPAPVAEAGGKVSEDVIAFDELFEKFCNGGGQHRFAYFNECWSKLAPEKGGGKQCAGALADGQADGPDGVLAVPAPAPEAKEAKEVKEKPSKRPIFDLSGLDKPAKPIETEPVHKHQLSDRAVHWQLHKDVPPYMIDRITMPSWSGSNKCDFACLGLRPHLMLKLVRKPQPEGEGPHSFSDLFYTVVVENPEACPWMPSGGLDAANARDDEEEDARGAREVDFGEDVGDEEFDGNGLPAHLDVDPQELFLRPDDKVVPGCDQEGVPDLPEAGGDAAAFAPGIDFDLVDQPEKVGNTDIGYSRNSKFVDVKLVKKHLWDCISEDIAAAKPQQASSSFQELVTRTIKRLPPAETENLSVQVCFICGLHLCNEKGLELKADPSNPLGDFAVVGPA